MGSPSETVCYVWQQIFTTHVQAEVKMYQLRHNISSSCQAVVIMCHLPMSQVTYLLKKETIRQRQHTYTRRDRQTQTDRQTVSTCCMMNLFQLWMSRAKLLFRRSSSDSPSIRPNAAASGIVRNALRKLFACHKQIDNILTQFITTITIIITIITITNSVLQLLHHTSH